MLATYPKYSKHLHEQCPYFGPSQRSSWFCISCICFQSVVFGFGHYVNEALPAATQIVARTYPIMYCGLGVYMHAYVYSNAWLSREGVFSRVVIFFLKKRPHTSHAVNLALCYLRMQ